MPTIPLTRDLVAIVDDEDYERLAAHSWYAKLHRGGHFYAARDIYPRSTRAIEFMHRSVLDAGEVQVDHINGNTLDNRRANLRVATNAQNMQNRGPTRANTSGFKGVVREPSGQWRAQIGWTDEKRRMRRLGVYPTPREAAIAYDRAAIEIHGEFARLNFPGLRGASDAFATTASRH